MNNAKFVWQGCGKRLRTFFLASALGIAAGYGSKWLGNRPQSLRIPMSPGSELSRANPVGTEIVPIDLEVVNSVQFPLPAHSLEDLDWLITLPDSESRYRVISNVVIPAIADHPARAFALSLALSDPSAQSEQAAAVLVNWWQSDPEAATAALEGSALTEAQNIRHRWATVNHSTGGTTKVKGGQIALWTIGLAFGAAIGWSLLPQPRVRLADTLPKLAVVVSNEKASVEADARALAAEISTLLDPATGALTLDAWQRIEAMTSL